MSRESITVKAVGGLTATVAKTLATTSPYIVVTLRKKGRDKYAGSTEICVIIGDDDATARIKRNYRGGFDLIVGGCHVVMPDTSAREVAAFLGIAYPSTDEGAR